jgi:type IV pilus assembly protein PilE
MVIKHFAELAHMTSRKSSAGFTMVELMIAVAIVGILATIAYSTYSTQIRHTRRSDALASVGSISSSLERCYAQAYAYSGCANATGGVTVSQNGFYSIATAVAASTYTVTATPVGAQAGDTGCAVIALSNNGQSAANSLGVDATKTCWGSS